MTGLSTSSWIQMMPGVERRCTLALNYTDFLSPTFILLREYVYFTLNVCTYCMLYVLALKNSTWDCVSSYPSYLCCEQGMGKPSDYKTVRLDLNLKKKNFILWHTFSINLASYFTSMKTNVFCWADPRAPSRWFYVEDLFDRNLHPNAAL